LFDEVEGMTKSIVEYDFKIDELKTEHSLKSNDTTRKFFDAVVKADVEKRGMLKKEVNLKSTIKDLEGGHEIKNKVIIEQKSQLDMFSEMNIWGFIKQKYFFNH